MSVEVFENPSNHLWLGDNGNYTHLAFAAWAAADVDSECALQSSHPAHRWLSVPCAIQARLRRC